MVVYPTLLPGGNTHGPEKGYMPSTRISKPHFHLVWPDLIGLALVVVVMVLSWYLAHGITRGMYDQFAVQGDPPAASGPVGGAGRNQLGHWGYFWSERAFHYRTTLMFAVDDYDSPETLGHDVAQQYPEGVDAWREYTLLMEPVYGQLYRWFGRKGEILVEFLTRLIPLIHVLMYLPLFLLARALGARPLLAVLAVVLYASCDLGYSRFSGSLLLKEDFALLWLMVFLAAHFQADRRRSVPLLLVAAISLVILLASWHLSQFLVMIILGALALVGSLNRDEEGTWPVLVPAAYFLAGMLAGLTPSLLARGFFFSLTMVVMVSWLAVAISMWRVPAWRSSTARACGVFIGLLVGLGAASFLNRHFTGDYNHIFGLLVQKLVHGFQRPTDPLLLPFDVRVFWASPFTSPTWAQVWSKLGWHLLILAPALAAGIVMLVKRELDNRQRALLIMTPVFCLGWLLIERLGVVFLPFLAVACAVVLDRLGTRLEDARRWNSGRSRQVALVALVLMITTPAANLAGGMAGQVRTAWDLARGRAVRIGASDEVYLGFRGDLLRWLETNTPGPNSRFGPGQPLAVLGDIGVSPQVLLYTGRPVVLNSQFENQPIRQRYEEFLQALFSTDRGRLRTFLQEVKAGYLFINRNWATVDAPGSAAYLAGLTEPLGVDMNISRLHFSPEVLDFLQPVYNNEFYRVFKVGPRSEVAGTWERNFGNWWNLKNYRVAQGHFTDLDGDRRRIQEFEDSLVALQEAQGRLMQKMAAVTPAGQPSLPQLHQLFMENQLEILTAPLDSRKGDTRTDPAKRIGQLVNAIQGRLSLKDPETGRPFGQSLAALFTRGIEGQSPGWGSLMDSGLAEPSHLAAAAQLLAMLGQYREAADLMDRAGAFFPLTETFAGTGLAEREASPLAQQVRQSQVWFHLAAEQAEEAVRLAVAYAPYAGGGSRAEKFYHQVGAIPSK